MDQISLVSDQIEHGRQLVDHLAAEGIPITAAAWLKPSEEGRWYLYLVTRLVDDHGLTEAYRALHGALAKGEWDGFSAFDIRLVGSADRLGEMLQSIHSLTPKRTALHWAGPRLGDVEVEDAFIYPPPSPATNGQPMATDEVLRRVYELMIRTGNAQPATVSLRDRTSFQGTPFGVEKHGDTLTVKFIELASGHVRSIPLVDVASVS